MDVLYNGDGSSLKLLGHCFNVNWFHTLSTQPEKQTLTVFPLICFVLVTKHRSLKTDCSEGPTSAEQNRSGCTTATPQIL